MALTKIDGANIDGTISEITDLQNRSSISTNFQYKNRIINGAMRVNRRLTYGGLWESSTIGSRDFGPAPASGAPPRQLRLENWFVSANNTNMIFSMGGGVDIYHTPLIRGIDNSLVIEPLSNSTASNAVVNLITAIPGDRLLDMKFGESGTRYATLSWYMKSPIAGTMTVFFTNSQYASISCGKTHITSSEFQKGTPRLYHTSVSISSGSWQRYSVTIPIDTYTTTNPYETQTWKYREDEVGLQIGFNLSKYTSTSIPMPSHNNSSLTFENWVNWERTSAVSGITQYFYNNPEVSGQTNFTSSAGNKIYITGVQFESGSSATDFETPPFDVEMNALSRRYFLGHSHSTGGSTNYGGSFYLTHIEPMIGSRFTSGTETNPSSLNKPSLTTVAPEGLSSGDTVTTTFCAYSFLWTDTVDSNHRSHDV